MRAYGTLVRSLFSLFSEVRKKAGTFMAAEQKKSATPPESNSPLGERCWEHCCQLLTSKPAALVNWRTWFTRTWPAGNIGRWCWQWARLVAGHLNTNEGELFRFCQIPSPSLPVRFHSLTAATHQIELNRIVSYRIESSKENRLQQRTKQNISTHKRTTHSH